MMAGSALVSEKAHHRWSVASRVLAGTLGAYGVASLVTVALSLVLARFGMDRVEAVIAATLASYAIFAIIAMAVFHARSAVHAWGWLIGLVVPLALLSWALMPGTTP